MANVVGELFEKPDEMTVEWRISKFLSSSKRVDKGFFSPSFFFAGACWTLFIYPYGHSTNNSEGCVVLALKRTDFGPPATVSFTLGVKKADGTEMKILQTDRYTFMRQRSSSYHLGANFIDRTSLENRIAEFLPSGVLTVACTLKNDRLLSTEDSLFNRLWDLSTRFMRILVRPKRTDFVLKFKGGEKRVHRLMLEECSPVFHRMLNTDMREAQTGEMDVADLDPATFNVVLAYIYSGDPKPLSTESVREVFKIAHLYVLPQLAKLCARFMLDDLSVNAACDVIALATLYQETEMLEIAKDFFIRNANEVIETEGWKRLKNEHPDIVSGLLENMVKKNQGKAAI